MKHLILKNFRQCLLAVLFIVAAPLFAEGVTIDGINYSYDTSTRTAILTNGNNCSGAVTIPESITVDGTNYSVTKIGFRTFNGCDGLTSVTIPNSVSHIMEVLFTGAAIFRKYIVLIPHHRSWILMCLMITVLLCMSQPAVKQVIGYILSGVNSIK